MPPPHGPNDRAEDLGLSQGAGYANLVDIATAQYDSGVLVAPGSVGSSYLVDKLRGVNLCSGTIMPKNGGPLSEAQIQAVLRYRALSDAGRAVMCPRGDTPSFYNDARFAPRGPPKKSA